jgi:hypothetical protein
VDALTFWSVTLSRLTSRAFTPLHGLLEDNPMFAIFHIKNHFIFTPGYHQYWDRRIEALEWADEQGIDRADIEIVPVIHPE